MTLVPSAVIADQAAAAPSDPDILVCRANEFSSVEIPADRILRGGRLDVFPAVIGKDYFAVTLHPSGVTLQARGFIGTIPLNDRLTIEVTPRVPIANIDRVVRVSQARHFVLPHASRDYVLAGSLVPSLVDVYSTTLCSYVEEIELRGLYKEYLQREADTSSPKGRIAMSRTTKRLLSRGMTHQVSVDYFERTADNPPNRAIKYAIWYLVQVVRANRLISRERGRQLIQLLNVGYQRLDAVTLDRSRGFLLDKLVTGQKPLPPLRSYYHDALGLARAIIQEQALSWDQAGKDLRLPSLVLNMSDAFEDYLLAVLRSAGERAGWQSHILDGNLMQPTGGGKPLFDSGDTTRATPDIVIAFDNNGYRDYPVLFEVKYKPKPSRDDLNQIIAYATSYRCKQVVMAQPLPLVGQVTRGLQLFGRVDGTAVYKYVFDLGSGDLQEEEGRFIEAVATLTSGTPVSSLQPARRRET